MRAQGSSSFASLRFLRTLWGPLTSHGANAVSSTASPVVCGPYNPTVHVKLGRALSKAKCPDQASSCVWNGKYFSLPPASAASRGCQLNTHTVEEIAATQPDDPKAGGLPLTPMHQYFAVMLSGFDVQSTTIAQPDMAVRQASKARSASARMSADSGKASGSFLLKQERPLLGEWTSPNPYLKVDYKITFESRGEYFLHLGYHCNFYQRLVDAGCPSEVAQQVLVPAALSPAPTLTPDSWGQQSLQQYEPLNLCPVPPPAAAAAAAAAANFQEMAMH